MISECKLLKKVAFIYDLWKKLIWRWNFFESNITSIRFTYCVFCDQSKLWNKIAVNQMDPNWMIIDKNPNKNCIDSKPNCDYFSECMRIWKYFNEMISIWHIHFSSKFSEKSAANSNLKNILNVFVVIPLSGIILSSVDISKINGCKMQSNSRKYLMVQTGSNISGKSGLLRKPSKSM